MKYKITRRLEGYFSAVLLLFSVTVGILFAAQFAYHTASTHELELKNQAVSMAGTISQFQQKIACRPGSQRGYGAYLQFISDISLGEVWLVDEHAQTIELDTGSYSLSYAKLPEGTENLIDQVFKGQVAANKAFSPMLDVSSITVGAPVYDSEGNIIQEAMSEEEATTLTKYITENQTEEIRTEAHEKYNTARQEWFEENKETLEAIQQKIDKAKADGVEPEFTEAEKQILTEQKNFINAASAGEFLGTINNNNLSKEFKESHLETLNADAYETPAYKDILQNINDYVKTHENEFSISVSKVEEFLNKATDKNYNRVATDSSEELKAPAASKPEEKADSTPDLGFSARENVNTSN